jgi:DNA-binding NtrC family response regulator
MGQAFKPIALVVEDDPMQRWFAATLFEESDMKVVECESAEMAVAALDALGEDVAVLFTDVNLAGRQSGADLAKLAKRRFPDMTVIVTSGNERPELPRHTTFLPKPWTPLEVLCHAERAVTRRH